MTRNDSSILQPGEGKTFAALGNTITSKADSRDTDGALWIMEYTLAPGFGGPPPHRHRQMRELFYVLEGVVTFRLDDRILEATPGTFVLVAPGTVHTFSNSTTQPAKYLGIVFPGGFEKYFDELPALMAQHGWPLPPEVMRELSQRYDMEMAGPPPGQTTG